VAYLPFFEDSIRKKGKIGVVWLVHRVALVLSAKTLL